MPHHRRTLLALSARAIGFAAALALAGAARAEVFDVDPLEGDTSDGAPPYSLRDAVIAANASPGPDTINLPAGTYALSASPADPSGPAPGSFAPGIGDLDISDDLTIVGAGQDQTSVSAAALDRVFDAHGVNLTLTGISILNGATTGEALPNEGGGVLLRASDSTGAPAGGATLTAENCYFSQNSSAVNGGAIGVRSAAGLAKNRLAAMNCVFQGNTAGYGGGAIALIGAEGSISNCEFITNTALGAPGAGFGGGAISSNVGSAGLLQISGCAFDGNTANLGGGLSHHAGALEIVRGFFQMNVAVRHGGAVARSPVSVASSMTIRSSNLFSNTAGLSASIPEDHGGAIWNFSDTETSQATISFSRLFGNTGGVGEEIFATGGGAVTIAENNWWGHDAPPSEPGEIGSNGGAPPIDADPVLVLRFTAPFDVPTGGGAMVTADLAGNSDGEEPAIGVNAVPDTVPIADWTEIGGDCTGPPNFTAGFAHGAFTTGFDVGLAGAGVVVDEQHATAPIEVVDVPMELLILDQPDSQTVDPGASAIFSVAVQGDPPFFFQWHRNAMPLAGETSSTLVLASAQQADEGVYYCRVLDQEEEAFSDLATLAVNDPPAIVSASPNQMVNCGKLALFHVEAEGTAPLEFQWFKDNAEIPGATTETLTIAAASEDDEAQYVCRVSNALATKFSDEAELLVFGCGGEPREPNGAEIVDADLPQVMRADSTGFGFIRVRNTSNLSWSRPQAYGLALLQNDASMVNWPGGFPRLLFEDALLVIPGPGGEHTFAFSIRAPSATGVYQLRFQMVEELVEFFGPTVERTIEVRNSVADWPLYE